MSKRVLFITYPFPPLAGGGISRSVNFVRELPKHGVEPVVLTASLSPEESARVKLDKARLADIPKGTEVIRLGSKDPVKLKARLRSLLGERFYSYLCFLLFPLLHTHVTSWTFFNIFRVRKILKERELEIFYTTSPPHNQLFLGFFLKLTTGSKWIADLRDPYTDGYQWSWPSKTHFRIARLLEKIFLKRADLVLVNTPEVKEIYLRRRLVPEEKLKVLTNGY